MTESQRFYARDILNLWENRHGKLSEDLEQEFLFHPIMSAIVTYRWILIKVAIEKSGKKKLQEILDFLETNKNLTTEEIEVLLKPRRRNSQRSKWALAA